MFFSLKNSFLIDVLLKKNYFFGEIYHCKNSFKNMNDTHGLTKKQRPNVWPKNFQMTENKDMSMSFNLPPSYNPH